MLLPLMSLYKGQVKIVATGEENEEETKATASAVTDEAVTEEASETLEETTEENTEDLITINYYNQKTVLQSSDYVLSGDYMKILFISLGCDKNLAGFRRNAWTSYRTAATRSWILKRRQTRLWSIPVVLSMMPRKRVSTPSSRWQNIRKQANVRH